jgi:hypothetical protein
MSYSLEISLVIRLFQEGIHHSMYERNLSIIKYISLDYQLIDK